MLLAAAAGCGGESEDRTTPSGRAPAPAEPAARGVMLIFPGGGWFPQPAEAVKITSHYVDRYEKLGWVARNVVYRPGGEEGYEDVVQAYDVTRRSYPGAPVCAVGESSGGHLALMLAARRPLACVEAVGAPTDLRALKGAARRVAVKAFGRDGLAEWSPVLHAGDIGGRVMLVQADNDLIVDPRQARLMKDAKPGAELVRLPPGRLGFMHLTKIDKEAYRRYLQAERRMLAAVERR